MLTLQDVLTPFVIKASLASIALALVVGGVQQGALAFQSFANVDHARQTTFVQLASETK